MVITYIMDFVSQGKKVKTKRNLTHLSLIYKRTLKYDLRNFFVHKPLGLFFFGTYRIIIHLSGIPFKLHPPPKKNS